MGFSVTILGSSSATPIINRNPSAHLININERLFLIDCAEGTQMQLMGYKIKFQKIHHVFISHLHGDHFFGLIGLISTLHLLGRKKVLHIYSPFGLEETINLQLRVSNTSLQFPLIFHALQPEFSGILFEDDTLTISAFPLLHSVPTHGYLFKEKTRPRKIKKDFVEKFNPEVDIINQIKNGKNFIDDHGNLHENHTITIDPPHAYSYAYCSDTAYFEKVIPFINGVDLLYHEATFLENLSSVAQEKQHSTAMEAAKIALQAQAQKLLLGHFSARYRTDEDLESFKREAEQFFPEVCLAKDGMSIQLY